MDDLLPIREIFLKKHEDNHALIIRKIIEQIINSDPEGFDFRFLNLSKFQHDGNEQVFYKGQHLGEIEYFQDFNFQDHSVQIGFRFNSISTQH